MNLIDIGDTPQAPPPAAPVPKKDEEEEEIVFSFEPIPEVTKDLKLSDENHNLLGDIDDDVPEQQQQQQQQKTKKKAGANKKSKKEGDGNDGDGEDSRKWYHMFYRVSYYRPYFDVDTVDVGNRILRSLVPTKKFFEVTGDNPDLYGPFWITTTLLFALAIASNFSNYITYWMAGRENEWGYSFNRVVVGAAVLYTYDVLASLSVWLTQKYWLKLEISLVSCLCVYGYSLSPFVFGTVKIYYLSNK